MIRRIAVTSGLVVLLLATVAWTQMEIRGVVSYVDPVTRTVHFTDGRTIQIPPGATLTLNGQPVVLESIQPEATAVLSPPGTSTTTVTTVTPPTHVLRSGHAGATISQLRPGDKVVVQVTNPARAATPSVSVVTTTPVPFTADRDVGAALPYQSYADTRIEAAGVRIIWSPQTP